MTAPLILVTGATGKKGSGAFMTVPLRPGMNPARYERQQGFPVPTAPRLAMADPAWTEQRAKTAAAAKLPSLKLAASA